jgi:hypothetical protein
MWQLQTENEAQRVLQEPTKQDAGLEGKQQMGLTRSPMVSAKIRLIVTESNITSLPAYLIRFYTSQQA